MQTRADLRNVAIVAHVDHGKTTLVDKMLWQSGAFRANQDVNERVMDSMDLEREKGITILAKNTAVQYQGPDGPVTINIVDTPGHADFGGEVERALSMVDGVLLLVDASEGPLPQTRFVLRKTLEAKLPVILVINKVDRPDARIAEVVHDVEELFLDLDADIDQLDFPIVYCVSREGKASMERPADGAGLPDDGNGLHPLMDLLLRAHPGAGVRPRDAAAGARHQPRRVAVRRAPGAVPRPIGHAAQGPAGRLVPHRRHDRAGQIAELYTTEALDRVPTDAAGPGEIVAVAGIPEITIGETLADPDDPRPLDVIHIDDPSLSMTVGINTSPLAGQEGTSMTARLVKNRLDAELVGNVSIKVLPTERPDTWEVQGRGELQLAVLVEMMRREGFELTVGKPQVLTREIDGVVHEPVDRLTVDVPEEFMGVITQLLALRKGRMEQIVNHGTGWVRLDYLVPARGLIGFRTELLTETRGTALLHHVFECYEPWAGTIRARTRGSLVADRLGPTTGYSLMSLQERGQLFVGPGEVVYEGMIVGENARADDMDVNPTKEKKLTNVRSQRRHVREADPAAADVARAGAGVHRRRRVRRGDAASVRLRKVIFDQTERGRAAKRAKTGRRVGLTVQPVAGGTHVDAVAADATTVRRDRRAVQDRLGRHDRDRGVVDRRPAVDQQRVAAGLAGREDQRDVGVGGGVGLGVAAHAVDDEPVGRRVGEHRQDVRPALVGDGHEVGDIEVGERRRQLPQFDLDAHGATVPIRGFRAGGPRTKPSDAAKPSDGSDRGEAEPGVGGDVGGEDGGVLGVGDGHGAGRGEGRGGLVVVAEAGERTGPGLAGVGQVEVVEPGRRRLVDAALGVVPRRLALAQHGVSARHAATRRAPRW